MTNVYSFSFPGDEPEFEKRVLARMKELGYRKFSPYVFDLLKADLERSDSLEEIRRRMAERAAADAIDQAKLDAYEAAAVAKAAQVNNKLQPGYEAIVEAGADDVLKRFRRFLPLPGERGKPKEFKDEWFAEYADSVLPANAGIDREQLISDVRERANQKRQSRSSD